MKKLFLLEKPHRKWEWHIRGEFLRKPALAPRTGASDLNIPKKMNRLIASPIMCGYFNDLSLLTDSLESTPEGNASLDEIIMATCMLTAMTTAT